MNFLKDRKARLTGRRNLLAGWKNFQFLIGIIFLLINATSCKENSNTPIITSVPVFEIINSDTKVNLLKIDCFNETTGFIIGQRSLIFKTIDGGLSWDSNKIDSKDIQLLELKVLDINTILIGALRNILKSTDGGQNWIKSKSEIVDIPYDFERYSNNVIYVGINAAATNSTYELLYKSEDKGDTWKDITGMYLLGSFSSLIVYDTTTFLLSSGNCIDWSSPCDNAIYKSTEIGKYKTVYLAKNGIYKMIKTGLSSLLAVGAKGTIITSNDKGDNWEPIPSGITETLYSIAKKDDNTYYAVGDSGAVLSTNDKGKSWTSHNSGVNVRLNDICFPSPDYAIAIGDSGTILKITFK